MCLPSADEIESVVLCGLEKQIEWRGNPNQR